MNSDKKLKILYIFRSVAHFTYQESIIKHLCLKNHVIEILFDEKWSKNYDDTAVKNFLKIFPNVKLGWFKKRIGFGRRWIFAFREIRSYLSYLKRTDQSRFYLNRWFNYTPDWFRKKIIKFPSLQFLLKFVFVEWILHFIEEITPSEKIIKDQIRKELPDVVVVTPVNMRFSEELEYVKAAKRIGIPVIIPILSWDNLTTKGLMHIKPDIVLAWNKMHFEEALKIHKIPRSHIIITGAPFFDKWFDTNLNISTRQEFCEKVGLDFNIPFITYLGSSKNIILNEAPLLMEFIYAIHSCTNPDINRMKILVRPHPANFEIYTAFNEEKIVVWPSKGCLPDTPEALTDFACSLKYSVACIGINTSGMIDAVILDRPCISINADLFGANQNEVLHFKQLLQSDCLYEASGFSDVITILNRLMSGDDFKKESRKKFVEEYIKPLGTKISAGSAAARIIEMIRYKKSIKNLKKAIEENFLNNTDTNEIDRSSNIIIRVNSLKQDEYYQNYLWVRDLVISYIKESQSETDLSLYWKEEIAGFDYMFDASPLIINKLREHCYHITGLKVYEYRSHHTHEKPAFERKLKELQEICGGNFFIPENPLMGGFGHEIDGKLINIDTLKFYECLIALNKSIQLNKFFYSKKIKKTILEIGAGWGGFAYQVKSLFPNTCYIIIDLAQTLIFSATYLKNLFPDKKFLFYDQANFSQKLKKYDDYDFIILPHYAIDDLQDILLDICFNLVSFQEMTSDQVRKYVEKIYHMNCSYIYSFNRDRSKHNSELTTVSSILKEKYEIFEIKILDIPYYTFKSPKLAVKEVTKKFDVHDYRHLFGKIKLQPPEAVD